MRTDLIIILNWVLEFTFRKLIFENMNFHSGAFLRDIRKIKKNSTVTLAMTTKDLTSLKDLGKTRSSDKINLNKLLDVHLLWSRIKTKKSKVSIRN